VTLSVSDPGIGMSREQVDRAFERFSRADSSDTAVPGTGLGLCIVKNIIEAHGGRCWIVSQADMGTTIHCFFLAPIQRTPDAASCIDLLDRFALVSILFGRRPGSLSL